MTYLLDDRIRTEEDVEHYLGLAYWVIFPMRTIPKRDATDIMRPAEIRQL